MERLISKNMNMIGEYDAYRQIQLLTKRTRDTRFDAYGKVKRSN